MRKNVATARVRGRRGTARVLFALGAALFLHASALLLIFLLVVHLSGLIQGKAASNHCFDGYLVGVKCGLLKIK